jgi:elongation factor Ts
MAISAGQVKELRERTGAGMMDCKKALQETDGDMEAAIDLLRSRGAAKAAKRAGKETSEGAIGSYVEGGVGGLVELNCETDFVARTEDFQTLADQLAQHVARNAEGVSGSVDGDVILAQPFLGGDRTVEAEVTAVSAKTGEKIVVRRAARFEGEPGQIGSYVHMTGKIGVLVELAGAEDGAEDVARDVAMHVAAANPLAVTSDEIPADVVERERTVYLEQVRNEGKPEHIQEKIVEGKLGKFYKENALLHQPFVKDADRSVADRVKDAGTDASVRRFVRYELGE